MKKMTLLIIVIVLYLTGNAFTQETKFKFIGVKKCKMCHKGEKKGKIFEKWEITKHAQAYAELASDKAKEVAKKVGLEGNPQEAAQCLMCHVTGYNASAELKTKTLTLEEGVSCEACHGAGSEYKSMKIKKAIVAGTKKGSDYGLIKPEKELCIKCHNSKSPTFTEFNFEEAIKKVEHYRHPKAN